MTIALRHHLILLATCGLVFFFNLGASRLYDEDEPKNAECGREMWERGDWMVPTYNYELRTDKPIMLYWLMLSSYHTLGVSEFAARLPSALMATLTVFCVYHIGRRLFDPRVGLWSAMILASTLFYVTIGRISTPDSTLIGFIVLSMLIYVFSVGKSERGWSMTDSPATAYSMESALPRFGWQFVLMYAVMGLAVLTKGPVGFLLPCAVLGFFLMCLGKAPVWPQGLSWKQPVTLVNECVLYLAEFWTPSRFLAALWRMRPFTLFVTVCAVALPWYVAVGVLTDGAWTDGFWNNHNVGRFSDAMEGHDGPIFYHVISIVMGFFPWSVFLPVSLLLAVQLRNSRVSERRSLNFLLSWAGVYFVFFSIAQTKLPNYVLPCYPPLALMVGWVLVRWQEGELALPHWAFQWSSYSLIVVGVLLIIALPIFSWILLPGYWALGAIGLIPLASGLWMKWHHQPSQRTRLMRGVMAGAMALVVVSLSGAAPWISRAQDSFQLGQLIFEKSERSTPLATFQFFTTNLPFYAQRPVVRYHSLAELQAYFQQHPDGILCLREVHWEKLDADLPQNLEVTERVPRFLREESVVMVRRRLAAQPPLSQTQSASIR